MNKVRYDKRKKPVSFIARKVKSITNPSKNFNLGQIFHSIFFSVKKILRNICPRLKLSINEKWDKMIPWVSSYNLSWRHEKDTKWENTSLTEQTLKIDSFSQTKLIFNSFVSKISSRCISSYIVCGFPSRGNFARWNFPLLIYMNN